MHGRWRQVFVLLGLFVSISWGFQSNIESCENIQKHYQLRGINVSISDIAVEGKHLKVCSSSLSCCTETTFNQFSDLTSLEFQNNMKRLTDPIKTDFSKKHKKFNDFFEQLIDSAHTALDDMFSNTYGELYSLNSAVFRKLFKQLKEYYRGKMLNVAEIFDSFFGEVMWKVFGLIHRSFELDDEYKECIADHMDIIKPFAASPDTLKRQFRRSFVEARTFVTGLQGGKSLAANVMKFLPSPSCIDMMVEMSHCGACRGDVETKPCRPYCEGVVKGCIGGYRALNRVWDDYLEGMRQLLNRLDGHFNIEAVLDTFEVKLSEAVMMLQENQAEIEAAVFRQCGIPKKKNESSSGFDPLDNFRVPDGSLEKLSSSSEEDLYESLAKNGAARDRRSADKQKRKRNGRSRSHRIRSSKQGGMSLTDHDRDSLRGSNIEKTRYQYKESEVQLSGGSSLASLLQGMKNTLDSYYEHWSDLPQQMCKNVAVQDESATCWNGQNVGSHDSSQSEDSEETEHPDEVDISANHVAPSRMIALVKEMKSVISQLKLGYKGIDPHLPPSDDDDVLMSGDGSGSMFDDPIINEELDVQLPDVDNREEKPTTECPTCQASSIAVNWILIGFSMLLASLTT